MTPKIDHSDGQVLAQPQYQTLEEFVYESLKRAIVCQELRPGAEITLQSLEEQLGVSRTPIRQALRRLAERGFATMLPNRTMRIRPLESSHARELYSIRRSLETLAISESVPLLGAHGEQAVDGALKASEVAYEAGDPWEILTRNREFHGALYRACGMPRLLRLIDDLSEQCERYRWTELSSGTHELAREQHRQLARAANDGDPSLAVAILIAHLDAAEHSVVGALAPEVAAEP